VNISVRSFVCVAVVEVLKEIYEIIVIITIVALFVAGMVQFV
jgi:hypothetical protein